MRGTFAKKALLLLCLVCLAPIACSKEPPNRPDRGEARQTTMATGDGLTPRKVTRKPTIEEAELLPGDEGDEILVVIDVRQPGYFPYCLLLDAKGRQAALRNGVYDGRAESRWPEKDSTETIQMGSAYVIVYHEDPAPKGKVANPKTTPYFVACFESGTMNMDEAHVDGTPKAPSRSGTRRS
jgi:hypothetical protein